MDGTKDVGKACAQKALCLRSVKTAVKRNSVLCTSVSYKVVCSDAKRSRQQSYDVIAVVHTLMHTDVCV
jgi:hypothetical protein